MLITDTIIRARNRLGYEDWNFLDDGVVYELTIPLDSTAYLFNVGHSLRIDISSSNFPRFETNPNTGDALWSNDTIYVANNSIHLSSTYPSKISIPTVDYESLTPFSFDMSLAKKQSKKTILENQTQTPLDIGWIKSVLLITAQKLRK
jgi:hypothetical protein